MKCTALFLGLIKEVNLHDEWIQHIQTLKIPERLHAQVWIAYLL